MNLRKWYFLDQTTDAGTPASGGAAPEKAPAASPSSDVDWVAESDPTPDDHFPAEPVAAPKEPVAPAPAASPPTPATPAPSAPAPAAAPVAAAPAPVAPAPVAGTPPATPAVVPAAPAPVAPASPAPTAPDIAALRAAEATRLTGLYATHMTEEVVRGLMVEPEKHLPALLARVQLDTADMVMRHFYATMPQYIAGLTQKSTQAAENEREFYTEWPDLNKAEYKPTIAAAIRGYRGLNPKATKEEVIRAAGLQAMIHHRLPLPAKLFNAPAAAPAAPAPGFTPAAPGASTPRPAAPGANQNAFALLNEDFDREERG